MSFYRCPTEVTIMSGRQEHSILHAALSAQERREYRSLKKKRYSSIDTRVSPGYRRVSAGVSPEYRRSIARYRNFTRHLAGISTEYRKLNPPWVCYGDGVWTIGKLRSRMSLLYQLCYSIGDSLTAEFQLTSLSIKLRSTNRRPKS